MGSWPHAPSPATIGPLLFDFHESVDLLRRLQPWSSWAGACARTAVRFLSRHSGVPALLVAAVLLVVGWRLLRKTARLAVEVALVTAALFAATQLGWIRW